MVAQQVFAIVSDGIIRNTIVCDNYQLANDLAKGGYGNEAFAVDCLQYPCQINDKIPSIYLSLIFTELMERLLNVYLLLKKKFNT